MFCFPENEELLTYWDRVEDRLNKIRSCQDISGVRRRLELFAPRSTRGCSCECAPPAVARRRHERHQREPAALPLHLSDREGRQHASIVQAFGDRVLSALEKRDAEELTRLRTVHEQNLLQIRSKSVQLEIDAAEDALAALQSQRSAAVYRREYFTSQGATGLLASESKQQQLQQQAGGLRTMAGISQMVASILTIIPDAGAPTAMKFGGSQLGAAGRAVAEGFNAVAAFTELGALMAGQEGSNRRREQEWGTGRDSEARDRAARQADRRRGDSPRHRPRLAKVHERSLDQIEAIFDLLRERFTSFGLFTWLSTELQKLHRTAFNAALTMARLAEQAYRSSVPTRRRSKASRRVLGRRPRGFACWRPTDARPAESRTELRRDELPDDRDRTAVLGSRDSTPTHSTGSGPKASASSRSPSGTSTSPIPVTTGAAIKGVRCTIPARRRTEHEHRRNLATGRQLRQDRAAARFAGARAAAPRQCDRHEHGPERRGRVRVQLRDERYMPFEGAGVNSRWQLTLPRRRRHSITERSAR